MMTAVALLAAGQVALAGAVLLRLRRVALAVIAISVLYWIIGHGGGNSPTEMFYLTFYLLEAAALVATPGSPRGLQILTWKRGIVLAAAAVPVAIFWIYALALSHRAAGAAALVALAALAAGMVISSRLGRYLVALFAIMLAPSAVDFGAPAGRFDLWIYPAPGWSMLTYLPLYLLPTLTACLVLTAARPRLSSSHVSG
jgi:hypothetical protein